MKRIILSLLILGSFVYGAENVKLVGIGMSCPKAANSKNFLMAWVAVYQKGVKEDTDYTEKLMSDKYNCIILNGNTLDLKVNIHKIVKDGDIGKFYQYSISELNGEQYTNQAKQWIWEMNTNPIFKF